MGNNAKAVDRYTLDDWRFVWPDVAGMARWRVRLQSSCPTCRTRLWIPLRTVARTLGPATSMWGLELPCNRVGCAGWRGFRAWVPETGGFVDLVAHRPPGQGEALANMGRHVERPRSLR